MNNWKEKFQSWSQPPSTTEQEKSGNAEAGIKKAIEGNPELASKDITVFPQGSYPANTNVRLDSDVDICVLCRKTFFYHLPQGKTPEHFQIKPATFEFAEYKNLVQQALIDRFGRSGVTRGDKAFDVHSNTYRVDADAIATFEYRFYPDENSPRYLTGTSFLCDKDGRRIHNYPQQSLENGRTKNESTGRRYKRVVRILKALRNEMQDEGVHGSEEVASFLIESLVYRVHDSYFGHEEISDDVKNVLHFLLGNLATEQTCSSWTEVNEIKFLFHQTQPWTRERASAFVWAAIQYTALK